MEGLHQERLPANIAQIRELQSALQRGQRVKIRHGVDVYEGRVCHSPGHPFTQFIIYDEGRSFELPLCDLDMVHVLGDMELDDEPEGAHAEPVDSMLWSM